MDEEADRLMPGRRDDNDDLPVPKRKRWMMAMFILSIFFAVVVFAVSQGRASRKITSVSSSIDDEDAEGIDEHDGLDDKLGNDSPIDDDEESTSDDDDENVDSGDEETLNDDDNGEDTNDKGEEFDLVPDHNLKKTKAPSKAVKSPISVVSTTTKSIWSLDLQKMATSHAFQPNLTPNLVFVKGMKIGGTSVAAALNHVSQMYRIKLAKISFEHNQDQNYKLSTCAITRGGSIYFRHGYRNDWQKQCMPNVKYVTTLRDPVSQQISFDAYILNLDYFIRYPSSPCEGKRFIEVHTVLTPEELKTRLGEVTTCNDTPYRNNLTLIYIANQIRAFARDDPGTAVTSTGRWVANTATYQELTGEKFIDQLQRSFFLVGITERINEFLVLLAIANGWDLPALYYKKCKQSNLDVPKRVFAEYFPSLVAKLEASSQASSEAYQWASQQFDQHVKALGPWFQEKVREYETGLKAFQASKKVDATSFKWQPFKYTDGHKDVC